MMWGARAGEPGGAPPPPPLTRVPHAPWGVPAADGRLTADDFQEEAPCDAGRALGPWLLLRIKPIERLVPVSFTRCRASTSGLSTWWSTTALGENWFRGGFPA